MVKTKSINIFNLNVPCFNHCRYCLLSWDNNLLGIPYDRSIKFARRFYEWLKVNHPEINFSYYFGYSMDHPHLLDVIKFMKETNSPSSKFLQFDGMKFREKEELEILLNNLKREGIEILNFTIYGQRKFHDKFASRKGDFDLMINTIKIAKKLKLNVEVGLPVIKDNLKDLDELIKLFTKLKTKLFLFTPHSGGRGKTIYSSKITINDYLNMSDDVKKYFNKANNKTPYEWFKSPPKEVENRSLQLSLMPSNIEKLENSSFEDIVTYLEELDESFYDKVPSFTELLNKYVDINDDRLYTKKDLYQIYVKRYIDENNLDIVDITDERYSGSIRY